MEPIIHNLKNQALAAVATVVEFAPEPVTPAEETACHPVRGRCVFLSENPGKEYAHSPIVALLSLPARNPAHRFSQSALVAMGRDFTECQRLEQCTEKKPEELKASRCKKVITRYEDLLTAMKSVQVLQDVATAIWKKFPHLAQRDVITILYPAGGTHVGSLALAFQLIEQGAPSARLILTEINSFSYIHMEQLLMEWARHNSDITIDGAWMPGQVLTKGGERWVLKLHYRGKPITLEYAIRDAEGYAHPRDIADADIWLFHDTGGGSNTDHYIWSDFLKHRSKSKVQIMVSENVVDFNPAADRTREDYYLNLPLSGIRIPGAYGCASFYSLKLQGESFDELGTSDVRSALVAATNHPLIQNLKDEEVDPFLVSASFGMSPGKRTGLVWLARRLLRIPGEEQQMLALQVLRAMSWSNATRTDIFHLLRHFGPDVNRILKDAFVRHGWDQGGQTLVGFIADGFVNIHKINAAIMAMQIGWQE